MEVRSSFFAGYLVFFAIGVVGALSSTVTQEPSVPKAISDPRDSIVKGLGFQGAEGLKVSGFDVRDALLGQSVAYEFDIEVDRKFVPIKLLEDVNHWDVVDLPIFGRRWKIGRTISYWWRGAKGGPGGHTGASTFSAFRASGTLDSGCG
ncbi:hypothetical protein HPP92_018119 [Vanilla planifolia]|uniref:Uncharacterized protein n=1 Tax=Vanilla planifolia TaxID=51239 RepID=A0A835UR82_VANPL|nr:hypothetical protein HPP92_018119 [Vanilla planifolia]